MTQTISEVMKPRNKSEKWIGNLLLVVRKNWYDGLWEIRYADDNRRWAGPFKTKREAVERLQQEEVGA